MQQRTICPITHTLHRPPAWWSAEVGLILVIVRETMREDLRKKLWHLIQAGVRRDRHAHLKEAKSNPDHQQGPSQITVSPPALHRNRCEGIGGRRQSSCIRQVCKGTGRLIYRQPEPSILKPNANQTICKARRKHCHHMLVPAQKTMRGSLRGASEQVFQESVQRDRHAHLWAAGTIHPEAKSNPDHRQGL